MRHEFTRIPITHIVYTFIYLHIYCIQALIFYLGLLLSIARFLALSWNISVLTCPLPKLYVGVRACMHEYVWALRSLWLKQTIEFRCQGLSTMPALRSLITTPMLKLMTVMSCICISFAYRNIIQMIHFLGLPI